jgi:class 3 adenylate cyclase
VTQPVLILHHAGVRWITEDAPGELVATLPNAQLRPLPGALSDRPELTSAAILSFLQTDDGAGESVPNSPYAVRTILFTDIEGSTAMMQRLGDLKGREVLREHEQVTRNALASNGGTEVKTIGDAFMAWFGSPQRALECAIALQRAFASREGEPLSIRVGINAGEPIAEDDDLFGSSVIIAARTAAQAKGGEILLTDVVRQLVAGKGFSFTDRGEVSLRGIEEPVRVHMLHWSESG